MIEEDNKKCDDTNLMSKSNNNLIDSNNISNMYSIVPSPNKDQVISTILQIPEMHPNMASRISPRVSNSNNNVNNTYSINIISNSNNNSHQNNSSSKNSLTNPKIVSSFVTNKPNNQNDFSPMQSFSPRKRPMRRAGINIKPLPDINGGKKSKKSFMRIQSMLDGSEPQSKCERIKNGIKKIIENEIEVGIMAGLTIIGLFASDLKTLYVNNDYDYLFVILYSFLVVCWFAEIVCSIIVESDYILSFFFWLDIFSIVSLLTEIETINEHIVFLFLNEKQGEKDDSTLSPKVATIVRMIRIIRLIRIVKVYKAFLDFLKNYEIRKKLEESRMRAIERIKQKEKKAMNHLIKKKNPKYMTMPSFTPTNANNISYNVNNISSNPNSSLFASNMNMMNSNTNVNQNINVNISSANPNTPNNNNAVAELALKKMILNNQKEEKKTLQMENKTKITKVLFLSFSLFLLYLMKMFIQRIQKEITSISQISLKKTQHHQ